MLFAPSMRVYSACIEDKDLDLLIKQLKKKITGQEKTVNFLKGKYGQIIEQKKELLYLIEQDKQKLKRKQEKLAQQKIEEKKPPAVQEKIQLPPKPETEIEKKKRELVNLLAEQKARELKAREEEKKKIQLAKEEARKKEEVRKKQEEAQKEAKKKKEQVEIEKKKQEQAELLAKQKERLYQAERERQVNLALEKAKNVLQEKDINYLNLLIRKQRELCAAVTHLEIAITAEEKNLKLLKETRKALPSPNKL